MRILDSLRHLHRRIALLGNIILISTAVVVGQQTPVSQSGEVPASAAVTEKKSSNIKVTFDENAVGVVIIESGGEKIRIDTARKTVESLNNAAATEPGAATSPTANATLESKQKGEGAYDFDKGEEPYDYRLINLPTPKSVPNRTWNLEFTHRFTQPIHPIGESGRNLFGLDSFGIASFGLTYGVSDKLYVSAYRSPLCQRGMCRTIELGIGYNILTQNVDQRVALSANASIEGNDNFSEEYTFNFQARMSARANKRLYLFFSPALHLNANGQHRFNPRPTDFFPPATAANSLELGTHTGSFGFGAAILIRPDVLATFEFTPRIGFKLGRVTPIFDNNFRVIGFNVSSHPEIGFGIQKNIGKHSFALTFSNTQTTTTSRYNSSNLDLSPRRLVLGFNLSRRF
jgi:hypothetical protein